MLRRSIFGMQDTSQRATQTRFLEEIGKLRNGMWFDFVAGIAVTSTIGALLILTWCALFFYL